MSFVWFQEDKKNTC